jgi:Legionella pneumophila major outer membrane protein precursor
MANRNLRTRCAGTGVVALLLTMAALSAQAQPMPPQPPSPGPDQNGLQPPVFIGSPQPSPAVPPIGPIGGPAPINPPPMPVGVCGIPPVQGSPFLIGQPGAPAQGDCNGTFFVGLQFDFMKPVVTNHLLTVLPLNNNTNIDLSVPSHSLDWTLSPKLELGWHLPEKAGDVILSYRLLASEGTGSITSGPDTIDIKSRLNVNLFDLDYLGPPEEFAPRWYLLWSLGARVAAAYYDSTATGASLTTQESNNFVGVGPKGALEIQWQTPLLAFTIYGRADASVMIGQITQKYYETVDGDPNNPLSGSIRINRTQSVPTFSFSTGLRYVPPGAEYLHFSIGYEWERWWSLGREEDARLNLTTNGFFIRGQFDF